VRPCTTSIRRKKALIGVRPFFYAKLLRASWISPIVSSRREFNAARIRWPIQPANDQFPAAPQARFVKKKKRMHGGDLVFNLNHTVAFSFRSRDIFKVQNLKQKETMFPFFSFASYNQGIRLKSKDLILGTNTDTLQ
jgi:hypothetical protein